MSHLVSVIIPTKKGREVVLQRAIDSVKKQTYKPIELFVIYEGKNAGEARNIGIKKAKEKNPGLNTYFYGFLDDDDKWMPDKLELQMEEMRKHPDCPLVTCYSKDHRFGRERIDRPPMVATQKMILNAFNYSSTSTYLCREDSFVMAGHFNESLPSAQEYELAIRLSEHRNVRCVPEVLVEQFSTEGQISGDWKKKRKGLGMVYKIHKDAFKRASKLNSVKLLGILCLYWTATIFGSKVYSIINIVRKQHSSRDRKRILFVHRQMDRGFIRTDYEMLSKHYDVTDFHFKGILSIPKLLWKMRKHNLIFVWFISLHTFFTAFSKKPKIYVAGGYDVANEPNIRYGLARGGILKRMVRHCLDHADRILTVSKANNEDLKNNFGDGYPVSMVYNCPDANLFKPSDEEKDKNLILTVGLVSRETWIRKGIAKFVDVAHFCNEMKAPYKFVVVGKIEPDMMKTVKDAQRTTENLTFTGFVPDKDLLAYYQRAKVYCQFSYYESYGLTVSESMLCECVPVVSDRKALPEVIGDYGFKVDIYDMNAIYNVIGKAVERSDKEGREFTLQNFSMTKRENALVEIIDGLLDAKPKKLAEEKKELHQSIGILKERFQDRQLTGVEIGVFKGEHAKELLSQLNIKKLYLVDPYEYRGLFGRKMDFWDAYGQARKNLQGFEKYEFILSKSKDAIASIPEKVDFVYIDGNHRFSSVLRDILDYNDILKSSGLLMGHDYRSKRNPDTSAAIILGSLLLDKKLKHDGMEWWFE